MATLTEFHRQHAAVESGSWLDDDGSRRVRHEIFDEIPYLACQLSVF
jgi:hypothetical protein